MKEIRNWHQPLVKHFEKKEGLNGLTIKQLLEVELGIFLLSSLLPAAPLKMLPQLLKGYEFPFAERATWTKEQIGYTNRARFILGAYKHSTVWLDQLAKYNACADYLRAFAITDLYTEVKRKTVSLASNRFEVFESVLSNPLPVRGNSIKWAESGESYVAYSGDNQLHFRFPEEYPFQLPQHHPLPNKAQQKPLKVSKVELLETARWIEHQEGEMGLPNRNWTGWVENLQLETYQSACEAFIRSNFLTLDGTTNVVGMLSAGKSTLMDLLAVWAARSGRRITLIVGDVEPCWAGDGVEATERLLCCQPPKQVRGIKILWGAH